MPHGLGPLTQKSVAASLMGREFLMQGFVSHRLEAVNSVVLKICVVFSSGIAQSHCT